MSLTPPLKVGKLQAALHTKAKDAPGYRFYALYDKVYGRDILAFAYARDGARGVVVRASACVQVAGWKPAPQMSYRCYLSEGMGTHDVTCAARTRSRFVATAPGSSWVTAR